MEEMWFTGDVQQASNPTIGQFIKYIEKIPDFSDQEKKDFALDHVSLTIQRYVNSNLKEDYTWQHLKNLLVKKYQSKLSLKDKILLRRGLIQDKNETCLDFHNRCVKCQYLLRDDDENQIFEYDILFNFVIGLKSSIYNQLLAYEKLSNLETCLNLALEIENDVPQQPVKQETVIVKQEIEETFDEDYNENFYTEDDYVDHGAEDYLEYPEEDGNFIEDENFAFKHESNGHDNGDMTFENEDTKPIKISKQAKKTKDTPKVTTKKTKEKIKDGDFKPKKGTPYKKASEWLQCPECDEKFYSDNVLQKHLFIKHGIKDENSKLVECPYCDSRCVAKKSLPTHIQLMHPEKALNKFRCDLCPKEKVMGRTEVANALHKALVHPTFDPNDSEKIFCQICEDPIRESMKPSKMERHIKLTHFQHELPQCEFCGKHFLTPFLLNSHVEQCHLLEGLTCDICGEKFTHKFRQKKLAAHKKHVHGIGKEIYSCEFCGTIFKSRSNLKLHVDRFHVDSSEQHICDECGKSFKAKFDLKKHKESK